MSGKGSITLGDVTVAIDDIYLDGGEIRLVGTIPRPAPPIDVDHYDVYDRSGQLLYRCPRAFKIGGFPGALEITLGLGIALQQAMPGAPTRVRLS